MKVADRMPELNFLLCFCIVVVKQYRDHIKGILLSALNLNTTICHAIYPECSILYDSGIEISLKLTDGLTWVKLRSVVACDLFARACRLRNTTIKCTLKLLVQSIQCDMSYMEFTTVLLIPFAFGIYII